MPTRRQAQIAKRRAAEARPPKPLSLHQEIVGEIVARESASTVRFKQRLLDALEADGNDRDLAKQWLEDTNFVPDAFIINPDTRHVIAYEVEISHHLSIDKIDGYKELSWILDSVYWLLTLKVYDRFRIEKQVPVAYTDKGYELTSR